MTQCSAQVVGCDSCPERDVSDVIRQGGQGGNPTYLSFWRKVFLFLFLWFITSKFNNNGKEMKHAVVFFPQPATHLQVSFLEVPPISTPACTGHSAFCRQDKPNEINSSWKEVFCLLFYEGFMNSVAETLAICLPLLSPCQRKLVCMAEGKRC